MARRLEHHSAHKTTRVKAHATLGTSSTARVLPVTGAAINPIVFIDNQKLHTIRAKQVQRRIFSIAGAVIAEVGYARRLAGALGRKHITSQQHSCMPEEAHASDSAERRQIRRCSSARMHMHASVHSYMYLKRIKVVVPMCATGIWCVCFCAHAPRDTCSDYPIACRQTKANTQPKWINLCAKV